MEFSVCENTTAFRWSLVVGTLCSRCSLLDPSPCLGSKSGCTLNFSLLELCFDSGLIRVIRVIRVIRFERVQSSSRSRHKLRKINLRVPFFLPANMPEMQIYQLGDFTTQAGATIPSAFIAYKSWGNPKNPLIVYPTWCTSPLPLPAVRTTLME